MNKLYFFISLIVISCNTFNAYETSIITHNQILNDKTIKNDSNKTQSYLPKSNGQLINHSSFSLAYNEKHEQAIWVYYILTKKMIKGNVERTNDFRIDKKVNEGSAELSDYRNSGYDRGHLAPAADMKNSSISMSESFLFSNISPQDPSFNRGIWKKLESLVREWVVSEGYMHIATGPILTESLGKIGDNQVTIPKSFYKIIYCNQKEKMIGFIIPNKRSNDYLVTYATTIDYIESITNINFFSELDDFHEKELESNINLLDWNFKN